MLRVARFVSVAAHPLVTIPLTVALTTRNWRFTTVIAATTILPLVVIILLKVRRGTWSDFDVTHKGQRRGLYLACAPLLALAALVLWLIHAPAPLFRGVAAVAMMFGAGLLFSRWLKVSIHLMFAAYGATLIGWDYPWTLALAAIVIAALGWSRHALRCHTWAELAAGFAIGVAGALFVVS
ncbi:MAG TPA: hypothetical protein VFN10_06115 [Thermoanaerobaculia bacterium]|nr:hypothetical protein [Thermoanaerobaculia bacterium]